MKPPRTALVGIGGYGRVHLQHLLEFHRQGELVFAAAVAFPPELDRAILAELSAIGCRVVDNFDALLAELPRLDLDFAVVPTPIHLHARMAIALLRAGLDVLVEKPLAATSSDAEAIVAAARETGRTVAVGFQYLHAPEVRALREQLAGGAIGSLRRLVVHAAWPRSHAYYTRNAWAGRLRVGSDWVLDSPLSNAMSHFFMVMLFVAARGDEPLAVPQQLRAELYRAQAIESFDTAVVHMTTAEGVQLDFYGTHSSRETNRPLLRISGTRGEATWVQDGHAALSGGVRDWHQAASPEFNTREQMLRDVLARRREGNGFICTPEMAALHVRCFATLHDGVPVVPVPATELVTHGDNEASFTSVKGLDAQLRDAARAGITLHDAGAAWARPSSSLVSLPLG